MAPRAEVPLEAPEDTKVAGKAAATRVATV